MADTIKLSVNGVEVEVPAGKNLIDAVAAVGIEIPHICYHPALGADGNCRMCLVEIEDGRPPLVPACKTRAAEGMKVRLDSEKIKKIQRDMMEFELINHPIDCPICDQAGECILQDYYMKYDAVPSRMRVPQVKKDKKVDFGAGVVHDQERCVLCARCVRFTRLITKTGELGIVNRTDEARVSIFPGRPLSNRYALNVVDLCPVGAMTSKDFRFQQRAWFLTRSKSVCHGCSKGCNIFIDHNREKYKDDVIYRYRPRHNAQVNGYFMCDEGRMTYKLENENRLLSPKAAGQQDDTEGAVNALKRRIQQAVKPLFVVSPNCSLEQMHAVQALAGSVKAVVNGYSDGCIKEGDGDDFLIQDDKSANRAAFALLGIDSGKDVFDAALNDADLVVSFAHDLSLNGVDCSKLAKDGLAFVGSYGNTCADAATYLIPVASYSEDSGSIINVDGILQHYEVAVVKNEPLPTMLEIIAGLGGSLKDVEAARSSLSSMDAFKGVDMQNIPAQGLALTVSEVDNVTA
ncbi:MAG: 2Fe-2S iron-sulfur cluster-binding protein [bacterium]|nr:2Fe-2S iron-sulfur cluster-binding protein [bacterium]